MTAWARRHERHLTRNHHAEKEQPNDHSICTTRRPARPLPRQSEQKPSLSRANGPRRDPRRSCKTLSPPARSCSRPTARRAVVSCVAWLAISWGRFGCFACSLKSPETAGCRSRRRTVLKNQGNHRCRSPLTNGHRPDDDRPLLRSAPERPGLEEMITEAEALRSQLADAVQRATRLLVALKHQRRNSRVLRSAIDSLRELKLGP